jgi:hypothetical protein
VEALAARIRQLSDGPIVVHHDQNAAAMPWGGRPPSGVHLVERRRVDWGGWSIVDATLRMMRLATESLAADWVVVVSGEHWPVLDLRSWEQRLDRGSADALLPTVALPHRLHFGHGDHDGNRFLARAAHRWHKVPRPNSRLLHKALSGASKLSQSLHPLVKLEYSLRGDAWFIGVRRRRGPVSGWPLYKGSEWIACRAGAVAELLATPADVTSWFEGSHIPDECYVQSVLHQASELVTHDALVTWVPPEPQRPTPGWMMLQPEHLAEVVASGAPFARKVDLARRPEVVRLLDEEVDLGRSPGGGSLDSAGATP